MKRIAYSAVGLVIVGVATAPDAVASGFCAAIDNCHSFLCTVITVAACVGGFIVW